MADEKIVLGCPYPTAGRNNFQHQETEVKQFKDQETLRVDSVSFVKVQIIVKQRI